MEIPSVQVAFVHRVELVKDHSFRFPCSNSLKLQPKLHSPRRQVIHAQWRGYVTLMNLIGQALKHPLFTDSLLS